MILIIGGGEVLKEDSTGYRILKRFVRRTRGEPDDGPAIAEYDAAPFFEGIEMGIDILQLAPRVNEAAAITAKYEIPTMQAADCVVCHKVMDPIAGLFQDYYVVDGKGIFGPRRDGWYEDMFAPGLEGEGLPADQRWRSLQWLGERTAKDPRFSVAMVKHVWYTLTRRKPLSPP